MHSPGFDPASLLAEDASTLDLTTHWLGFGGRRGIIRFSSRVAGVLSGSAVASDILEYLDCEIIEGQEDGSRLVAGKPFLVAVGRADRLHRAWKVALSVLDHSSGIATRTARLVESARRGNPHCGVFTTRKHMPGIKNFSIKAILDGGALPHRLGLSETVLIFDQHKAFFEGTDALCSYLAANKASCCEKKIFVEVEDLKEAEAYLSSGADGVQFDKVPVALLSSYVERLRAGPFRSRTLIAAGGVNADNAEAYAASGVDGLATSWPYDGSPLDMTTSLLPYEASSSVASQ